MPVGVLQILDRVADRLHFFETAKPGSLQSREVNPACFHRADPPRPDAHVESRSNSIAPMVNVKARVENTSEWTRLRRQGESKICWLRSR